MPFITHGKAPNFESKAFCCLLISGRWKLHHFENNRWKRIDTNFPEDATECSPTAEYDIENDKWKISFIAGGYESDRKFYLYKIDDLENPLPEKISQADVGFIFKNKIVYGGRTGELYISDGNGERSLSFKNIEYLYRVSYNANNPQELLISGQYRNGELFSWILNERAKTLYEFFADGEVAYKTALFNDKCYYAHRNADASFEDRQIVEATYIEKRELEFEAYIEITNIPSNPNNIQMAKNFANASVRFAKSGFKLADEETLTERNSICSQCEFWKASARLGLGKCLKCGCSSAKLLLASEKCTIGKW